MRQGAQGWCTGMTQRDGRGRELGGGFRMGVFHVIVFFSGISLNNTIPFFISPALVYADNMEFQETISFAAISSKMLLADSASPLLEYPEIMILKDEMSLEGIKLNKLTAESI